MELTQYVGVKKVKAARMSLMEYHGMRGWRYTEARDKEGYLVEYEPDEDNPPNVRGYAGYISWCPKKAFEKSNVPSDKYVAELRHGLKDHEIAAMVTYVAEALNKVTSVKSGSDTIMLQRRQSLRGEISHAAVAYLSANGLKLDPVVKCVPDNIEI